MQTLATLISFLICLNVYDRFGYVREGNHEETVGDVQCVCAMGLSLTCSASAPVQSLYALRSCLRDLYIQIPLSAFPIPQTEAKAKAIQAAMANWPPCTITDPIEAWYESIRPQCIRFYQLVAYSITQKEETLGRKWSYMDDVLGKTYDLLKDFFLQYLQIDGAPSPAAWFNNLPVAVLELIRKFLRVENYA